MFQRLHTYLFLVTLIMLSVAASYGWTSPTLPKLLAEDSPIPITPDESSWIVSILVLASIFGPIPTAFLVDRYDDKKEITFYLFIYIIAYILKFYFFHLILDLVVNRLYCLS